MKNLYRRLGLECTARTDRITSAIEASADPELAAEAESVLLNKNSKLEYDRIHLQYRAVAIAMPRLWNDQSRDNHDWRTQLSEFKPQP